jgi:hypothetical protein
VTQQERVQRLTDLLHQIHDILQREHVVDRYPGVARAIASLKSCDPIDHRIDTVRSIFRDWSGPGGFFDYGIWRDDSAEREALNEPLDRLRDDLWTLLIH